MEVVVWIFVVMVVGTVVVGVCGMSVEYLWRKVHPFQPRHKFDRDRPGTIWMEIWQSIRK